ncbi:hypothetical protein [Desulfolucanica intricata]|uniref:hypothetical protein n=1 Tax=Desulfolucanica intricata TaxID=1285191 RepID=UPI000830282A|nr:hypothetical protein [Desulfolucanica intricata]
MAKKVLISLQEVDDLEVECQNVIDDERTSKKNSNTFVVENVGRENLSLGQCQCKCSMTSDCGGGGGGGGHTLKE